MGAEEIARIEAARLRTWLIDTAPPTQAELARKAGVSKQVVWQTLHGLLRPSPEILKAAEELGLPPFTTTTKTSEQT